MLPTASNSSDLSTYVKMPKVTQAVFATLFEGRLDVITPGTSSLTNLVIRGVRAKAPSEKIYFKHSSPLALPAKVWNK